MKEGTVKKWLVLVIAAALALAAGAAFGQTTVKDGQTFKAFAPGGTTQAGVEKLTDSTWVGHVQRYDASGNALVLESAKDRDFSIRYTNIINNYAAKTLPAIGAGAADSSIMLALNGVSKLNLVLYYLVSDSATTVRYQLLFVQARYGFGTANDSTGAFPIVQRLTPATTGGGQVDTLIVNAGGSNVAPGGKCYRPLAGEQPLALSTVAGTGSRYVIVPLPDPPLGATYVSIRLRPGATFFYALPSVDVWAKAAMGYRVDLFGGR